MFHKEHFCHVSSTNRGCPQYSIYVYKTTDSVETMLSAGYFNGALLDLHKNDVILAGIISDIDDGQYSTAWFRVIKRSLDAIEVEQVLTSADNITYDGTGTNYLSQFDNVQDAISALDAELKKESTERTQGQESLQGQIDGINEKIPEAASASNQLATESDINTLQGQIDDNSKDIEALQGQIDDNSKDIEALQGAGGALTAYNFNTATPTQETLTKYAVDQIWVGNTNWAWNAENPAASTFTDANGVARTAAEIFNSTWVNNTYDDHRWQLTNTQNTAPKVFEWADVGRDIVSVATATTAGIVRVGSGSQMVVNASTGDISLDGSKASSIRTTIGAVANNQGTDNAGKFMGVNTGGDVVPTEIQFPGDYVIYWDSADTTDHSHAKPGVTTPTDHGWYRVYKSGWCEQGGRQNNTSAPNVVFDTVYLHIPMKDKNYSFSGCFDLDDADTNSQVVLGIRRCRYSENDTPEKAIVATTYNIDDVSGATGHYYNWEVKGWAA